MVEEELSKAAVGMATKAATGMAAKAVLGNPYVLGGIVVLIILAIGAFIIFVPAVYKGIILTALAIGAVVGGFLFLLGLAKGKKFSLSSLIANILLIGGIAFAIIMVIPIISPQITSVQSFASTTYSQVKGGDLFAPFSLSYHCLLADKTCTETFAAETKTTQGTGKSTISVDFSNAIKKEPVDVIIPIKVMTQVPLEITPTCLLENTTIRTFIAQDTLEFAGSNEEQPASVRCYSEKAFSDILKLKFETSAETSTSIIVGGETKGLISKTEKGPYTLTIKSSDPMPFSKGTYPVTIELKKSYDFVLTKIDSFTVDTISSNIIIDCDKGTGNAEEMKSWLKDKDTYLFNCDLEVIRAPLELAVITVDLKYGLEAEYRTILKAVVA